MNLQNNLGLALQVNNQSEDPVEIGIATTTDEKEAIYKFRYQVYIEEMGKPLDSADHANNLIHDPMDDWSVLVYAQTNGTIIGTLRLAIAKAAQFSAPLQKTFCMGKIEALFPQKNLLSLATKLAVKANYRGSQVLYSMLYKTYEICHEHDIKYTFGGCNPYLIPLYEQMGFRRFTGNFTDPGYGMLTPLVLVIGDISHFRTVRSPFYRMARRWTNDAMPSIKFLDAFPSVQSFVNTQLISKEGLWDTVTLMLGSSPLRGIPALNGLNKEDAAALLHLGAVFPCVPGDQIYGRGEKSSEIYILLSGALLLDRLDHALTIRPGDCFGSSVPSIPQPVRETVTAVKDANILVISWQALERFSHKHPAAASQVMKNLERLSYTASSSDTAFLEELS